MARHNLGTVIRFEVFRTLSKKRFWVIALSIPVLIGVVFALIYASNSSASSSADNQEQQRFSFGYLDESGLIVPSIVDSFGGHLVESEEAGTAEVREEKTDAFFVFPKDPVSQEIKVFGIEKGVFENGKYAAVASSLMQQSAEAKIGSSQLSQIISGKISTTTVTFEKGEISGGFQTIIPALLFLIVFYLIILLLGNQMLNSTLEEKENRVTEMILTTINPTSLIIGKVVSLVVVGFVQMLLFALPVVCAFVFFRSQLNLPEFTLSDFVFDPQKMIVGSLVLVAGFMLFLGALVALGAAMPTAKDAGPIFGTLMGLIFVPFYIFALIISDPNALIVQVFSYFPPTAPVTALLRNAFGALPLWQAVIIIVELFILSLFILRLAVRLFRYGAVEYSRKLSIKELFSSRRAE